MVSQHQLSPGNLLENGDVPFAPSRKSMAAASRVGFGLVKGVSWVHVLEHPDVLKSTIWVARVWDYNSFRQDATCSRLHRLPRLPAPVASSLKSPRASGEKSRRPTVREQILGSHICSWHSKHHWFDGLNE